MVAVAIKVIWLLWLQSVYHVDELSFATTIQLTVIRGLTDTDPPAILGPVNIPATVSYYFLPQTASNNEDFIGNNGSVGFSPGTTQTSLSVQILSDNIPEIAEQFKVIFSLLLRILTSFSCSLGLQSKVSSRIFKNDMLLMSDH